MCFEQSPEDTNILSLSDVFRYGLVYFSDSDLDSESDEDENYRYKHKYEMLI